MKDVYVVDYLVRDALGNSVENNYQSMPLAQGPQTVTRYDTSKYPQVLTTNGYQSHYENTENIGIKIILDLTDEIKSKYPLPKDTAVLVGSFALGTAVRDAFTEAFEQRQRRYSPTKLFLANHDLLSSVIAGRLRLEAISTSLNAACSSSMFNLYMAWLMIQSGETSTALVGAVDSPLWPTFHYYWQSTSAISTANGGICRPFDRSRDGFLQGEGGTLWLLCDEQYLKDHNLTPRARLCGVTAGAKMASMTAHDKTCEHQLYMIDRTLNQSRCSINEMAFFNAHATSTLVGDDIELDVFQKAFNDHNTPIVSFKGYVGHTMSACGLIESAYGLEAVRTGLLHPNYDLQDPLSDDPRLITQPAKLSSKKFMKASFGFGGRTSIAIFESL